MEIDTRKASSTVALSQIHSSQISIKEQQMNTKPLPRLPRGWSRVCHEISLLLRTMGLGIVVVTLQGLFSEYFVEPSKAAIIKNRFSALSRSLIHIIPVGIALMEVIINCNGRFVGADFNNQTYLQFAAKAHEMTVQASLATVILAYLRHTVIRSPGVPFGAFLGSIQFVQISYLWSTEFWSSLLSKQFRKWNKLNFFALAVLCTLIAATAGPSSASLLIPRQNFWTLESFRLSINATSSDIWPDSLDGGSIPGNCSIITTSSSFQDPGCPLNDLVNTVRDSAQNLFPDALTNESDHNIQFLSFGNTEYNYEKEIITSFCQTSSRDQYCATSPQEIFVPVLTNPPPLGTDVILDTEPKDFIDLFVTMRGNLFQPYSIASCLGNTIDETSLQTALRFPRLSETETELRQERETLPVVNSTAALAFEIPGNTSQYRTAWIDLPQDLFQTKMPGLLLIHPKGTNGSINITTCTLNAGWGSSQLMQHIQDEFEVFSTITGLAPSWPTAQTPEDMSGTTHQSTPNFANFSGQAYPQHRISISHNWMNFLNPRVLLPGQNTTLVDSFLSRLSDQPSEAYVARFISILLANGLSRNGWGIGRNVTLGDSTSDETCTHCMKFEIQRSIYGWSYQIDSVITKLAITVMIVYCALALTHIIYAASSGISSFAWDSTAEIVALAMNSTPTRALQNTCAGIIGTKAFKTSVKIVETTDGHLELFFGDEDSSSAQISSLKVNEK